jgi:hypothetical protein
VSSTASEATTATEATSGTVAQTPIELLEGMLIYSQDFDDFADSTGRSMPALEWDAPTAEQKTYAAYRRASQQAWNEYREYIQRIENP